MGPQLPEPIMNVPAPFDREAILGGLRAQNIQTAESVGAAPPLFLFFVTAPKARQLIAPNRQVGDGGVIASERRRRGTNAGASRLSTPGT